MPSPLPSPKQLRMEALRDFHRSLTLALAETSPQAGPPSELAAAGLSLRCEQCGIQISGPEWAAVVAADNPDTLGDPRLARLHQGYCPRKNCNSHYYRVTFAETPGVDWHRALTRAERAPTPPPPSPQADATPAQNHYHRRHLPLRLALGLALVLILLLIRRLWTGGPIPLLRPARKFTVDPASVRPDTVHQ